MCIKDMTSQLPWKPGWLCRRPGLSGTPSLQPLFSSCSSAGENTTTTKTIDYKLMPKAEMTMWSTVTDVEKILGVMA